MGTPNSIYDLVAVRTSTIGTGTLALGSALLGFLTPAQAAVPNGAKISYSIRDGGQSEVGGGTYSSSANTITRDTVYSSTNSNAKISLSGGAVVAITISGRDIQALTPVPTAHVPVDHSGASPAIVLTASSLKWFRLGKLVFLWGQLKYPAVVTDTHYAAFSLPVASSDYAACPAAGNIDAHLIYAEGADAYILTNDVVGGVVANNTMAGKNLNFMLTYPTA